MRGLRRKVNNRDPSLSLVSLFSAQLAVSPELKYWRRLHLFRSSSDTDARSTSFDKLKYFARHKTRSIARRPIALEFNVGSKAPAPVQGK
ncbi:hypothetical protein IQ252_05375 [Tychonema sp. LEGE 07203]|nr:hypothetical protein [Tychonema sp. LEGE 07203]